MCDFCFVFVMKLVIPSHCASLASYPFPWQHKSSQAHHRGKKGGVVRFRKRTANLHKTRHLLAFSVVHQPEMFSGRWIPVFIPLSASFLLPQTTENSCFLVGTYTARTAPSNYCGTLMCGSFTWQSKQRFTNCRSCWDDKPAFHL